jgi:hypothetical protein
MIPASTFVIIGLFVFPVILLAPPLAQGGALITANTCPNVERFQIFAVWDGSASGL